MSDQAPTSAIPAAASAVEEPNRTGVSRATAILFLMLFTAYAYFHPGGGWNQNGRFDQVRAVVESGRFAVNDYLSYVADAAPDGRPRLRRISAALRRQSPANRYPINSGDLTFPRGGRVYPNKPPGTTLLGLPAYWLIHRAAWSFGADLDDWWPLTLSAWLTSVLSVGLLGALLGAATFRVSLRLFPRIEPRHHAMAALTLGLGTLVFPFSTIFIDHVPVAALLMFSFALLLRAGDEIGAPPRRPGWQLFLAGLCAGGAVLTHYSALPVVGCLAIYGLWRLRSIRMILPAIAGGGIPLAALAWYHASCLGGVFVSAYADQPQFFKQPGTLWLGVFAAPSAAVLVQLLFLPHRGLFYSSPVLLLSAYGLWRMIAAQGRRAEAGVVLAVLAAFLLVNSSFNGWDGGYTFGPRYLVPALPFLGLSLAPAFSRLPRLSASLAFVSAAMMLLATAVDIQPPSQVSDPMAGHVLPLMAGRTLFYNGQPIRGPVSANATGVYERGAYTLFPPGSPQAVWNSFNLGEFLFPSSRASLAPLLLLLTAGFFVIRRLTRLPRHSVH